MKCFEFQAKTVEKAIEKGLEELGKSRFDVSIKILENGGLFKKAKVQISFEDEEVSLKDLMTGDDKKITTLPNLEKRPVVIDNLNHDNEVATLPLTEENRIGNEGLVETVKAPDEVVEEVIEETVEEPAVSQEAEIIEPTNTALEPKTKKERVYSNNQGSKQFIEGLLNAMNVEATVEIVEEDEHSKASIKTEQAGLVIGHRGEGLSAIQYLANIVEQKTNKYAKRLICDVADYRERRDDSLKDLADRMAREVLKKRKAIKLKPMNAYDRRIVHTYLQNFKGVNTHSVGKEPNRCLIIDINKD